MKRLALLLVAACSSKSSPPPPAHGSAGSSGSAVVTQAPAPMKPPLPPPPTMKSSKPIDLSEAGITQLELIPTVSAGKPGKGTFDIQWKSPRPIESGVVCRVESYNLAYFSMPDTNDSLEHGQHSVFWHPDPFVVDPDVCEVRFVGARRATIASACYRAGNMTEGPCPAGTFPPPKLDSGQVLDIQGASVQTNVNGTTNKRDGLNIRALYTVAVPLDHVSFDATCDGVTSQPETAEDFVPPEKLRAGETTFAYTMPLNMNKPLAKEHPDKCEVHASQKGKRLATFCIAEGQTDRGPCPK
jgi:hypothetical protein